MMAQMYEKYQKSLWGYQQITATNKSGLRPSDVDLSGHLLPINHRYAPLMCLLKILS
jgi:hypothetical protein